MSAQKPGRYYGPFHSSVGEPDDRLRRDIFKIDQRREKALQRARDRESEAFQREQERHFKAVAALKAKLDHATNAARERHRCDEFRVLDAFDARTAQVRAKRSRGES
jgi:hypothetical protein